MCRHINLTCPYPDCRRLISLPAESTRVISLSDLREPGIGTRVSWGFCTACRRIIILREHGIAYTKHDGDGYFGLDVKPVLLYPLEPPRSVSDLDIPADISRDFNEAAAVLPVSPKASAALSRRLVQHILREKLKIKRRALSEEINEFLKLPGVSEVLAKSVDAIRQVGNFAAHPVKDTNTGEIVDVEEGEAQWSLDVLEALFDFAYIQPARLVAKREELNRKLAAAGKPPMK